VSVIDLGAPRLRIALKGIVSHNALLFFDARTRSMRPRPVALEPDPPKTVLEFHECSALANYLRETWFVADQAQTRSVPPSSQETKGQVLDWRVASGRLP
jgi:hypothetical protein